MSGNGVTIAPLGNCLGNRPILGLRRDFNSFEPRFPIGMTFANCFDMGNAAPLRLNFRRNLGTSRLSVLCCKATIRRVIIRFQVRILDASMRGIRKSLKSRRRASLRCFSRYGLLLA